MKIYVDLETRQILKYEKEVDVFKGNVNIDKVKVYSIHHSANRPALLLAFKRADNRVISDILCDPDYPITETIEDKEYDYYEFTLSAHNGVLAVEGALQCTLWANDGTNKYGVCNFTLNVVESVYNDNNIFIIDDTSATVYDFKEKIENIAINLAQKVSKTELNLVRGFIANDIANAENRANSYADDVGSSTYTKAYNDSKKYTDEARNKAEINAEKFTRSYVSDSYIYLYGPNGSLIASFSLNGEYNNKKIVIPYPTQYSDDNPYGYVFGSEIESNKIKEMKITQNKDYVYTFSLISNDGKVLASTSLDLPLEEIQNMMLTDVTFDNDTNELVFHLHSKESTSHTKDVRVPIGSIINGLATTEQLDTVDQKVSKLATTVNQNKNDVNLKIKQLEERFDLNDETGSSIDLSNKVDKNADVIKWETLGDDGEVTETSDVKLITNENLTSEEVEIKRHMIIKSTNSKINDMDVGVRVNIPNSIHYGPSLTLFVNGLNYGSRTRSTLTLGGNGTQPSLQFNNNEVRTLGEYLPNGDVFTVSRDYKTEFVKVDHIKGLTYRSWNKKSSTNAYTNISLTDDGFVGFTQQDKNNDIILDTRLATLEDVDKALGNVGNVRYRNYVGDGTRWQLGNVMRYGFLNSLKGNSVVSKNLLKIEDKTEATVNGVTYSIKNGVITLNGKATQQVEIYLTTYFQFYANIDYYIKDLGSPNTNIFTFVNSSKVGYANNQTFKSNENFTAHITFTIRDYATTFNNVQIKPMIIYGTIAPTEFEPYFDGIKSSTVSAIKSVGRNRVKESWFEYGATQAVKTQTFRIIPNTDYTFSLPDRDSDFGNIYVVLEDNTIKYSTTNVLTFNTGNNNTCYLQINSAGASYTVLLNKLASLTQKTMLNLGTTALPYEPYVEDYLMLTGNMFDKSKITQGKEWDIQSLTLIDSPKRFATDYVEIEPNATYTFSNKSTGSAVWVLYYDKDKNYLSQYNTGTVVVNGTMPFTTPSNARYMLFNGLLTEIDTIMLNVGKEALPYSPFGAIKQKVRRTVAEVDLGDLDYTYDNMYKRFLATLNNLKISSGRTINLLCPIYETKKDGGSFNANWDNVIYNDDNTNKIYVHNHLYSNATDFKNAMKGVKVVYELETPIEEEYDGVLRGIGEVRDVLIPSTDNEQMRLYKHGSIDTLSDVDVTIDYDYCVNTDESEGE